mgnify:FL=1
MKRELDRFTQFAVEHLSDATYWMEEDARIIYANEAASRLVGYSIDELMAMRVYDLNVDLDHTRWPAIWALLKAEGTRTFEARHRHRDGRVLEVEIAAHFLELDGKEYSCAFVRDIGERKVLEQRLRHAEKMEAVGRLAGGVAHDFNNQLAGILGYAEVLRLRIGDDQEALDLLSKLTASVNVAAGLPRELLAFARRGKIMVEVIDLHEVVDHAMSVLSRSIDRRIAIESSLEAARPWVLGDSSQLTNVVLNLCLNARDAMPDGGTMTLSTRDVEIGENPDSHPLHDLQAGSYVALSIRDDGIGMDSSTLSRIFEPFYTTKPETGGSGLGLSGVYGAVKNHKGAIDVDSSPGVGTRFTIYLPVTRRSSVMDARRESGEPLGQRLSGHVLLVEDDPSLLDVCARMLDALGCGVTTASDGVKAVQLFETNHEEIDLVLLDLVLPRMNGPETFLAMRDIEPSVQVVVMSGYSLDGEAQSLIESGAIGFLQKPFTLAALARAMTSALS